ncbi:uncharacterized protein LOC143846457 [Tasmannia lanceolata]|uniref:uncharacterized protein LOC143846457 n=1 Tax=Tasmannia lanceolata TaxID=3420 RepID=UPI004063C714
MNPLTKTIPSQKWELGSNSKRFSEERVGGCKKGCFSWKLDCRDVDFGNCSCVVGGEKHIMMGFMLSQRSGFELLQNCDLPPPLKVFSGEIQTVLKTSPSMKPSPPINNYPTEDGYVRDFTNEKLGLLKALQLSQTRAREAEKKVLTVSSEKNQLTALFFQESYRLFAHRHWLKLLEIEISQLRSQLEISSLRKEKQSEEKKNDDEDKGSKWWALAMCLSIASFGLALGYGYLF